MVSKKSRNFLIANKVKSFISDKKGQSMSINVIIVAVIALVILVVLIAIFTGRIGIFTKGTEKAGEVELTTMKITYGDCHPDTSAGNTFITQMSQATNEEIKETARSSFKDEISRCKAFVDKGVCEGNSGCKWN